MIAVETDFSNCLFKSNDEEIKIEFICFTNSAFSILFKVTLISNKMYTIVLHILLTSMNIDLPVLTVSDQYNLAPHGNHWSEKLLLLMQN